MSDENQAQADHEDQTPVANPLDVANSTESGTNTALDDWHASVAALDLDESSESTQGEQPADEEAEESQENSDQSEESQEQEAESEEDASDAVEDEEPEPEAKASKRIRLTDPTDQKVAFVAKVMGINFVEAAKIVEAQSSTKHQAADQEDSQEASESAASVTAAIKDLQAQKREKLSALEFEAAADIDDQIEELRDKRENLKIAEVQEKSKADADAESKFYAEYEKSEIKTIGLYPDAAKPDSPMAKEMARLEAEMLELGDPLYHSTDKPFILAKEAAKNLGIPMKKPGSPPAKKPVQHRPMQPAGGNARTTTTDSAKKASEAIDGIGSMRDWRETVASL